MVKDAQIEGMLQRGMTQMEIKRSLGNKVTRNRIKRVSRRMGLSRAKRKNLGTHAYVELLRRCGTICPGCSRDFETMPDMLQVDHVTPIAEGGDNHPSNLQLLCRTCNGSKASKTMKAFLASGGGKRAIRRHERYLRLARG